MYDYYIEWHLIDAFNCQAEHSNTRVPVFVLAHCRKVTSNIKVDVCLFARL